MFHQPVHLDTLLLIKVVKTRVIRKQPHHLVHLDKATMEVLAETLMGMLILINVLTLTNIIHKVVSVAKMPDYSVLLITVPLILEELYPVDPMHQ
jgi:hypothetical protein